ncbi:fasciclin domain-containing protein [Tautonia plasticadhaerens]|uniref:Immunogenic protein MPT70 n=1 Tax=Tautonia plasticadhaerens TaxID=2527974 RepID=A0A518HBH0_9BACT|nr:fasciclin domain-containing protein [Tautonia plasticadhaerens]QDV38066.1 Immunogenic protein MPT70 precursor [Tautonia plasticadhaerens]
MRTLAALSLALVLGTPAFAQEKTIVETAAGNDAFSTLVAAVKAADLVEVLSSEGPFTVFAPTDEAFAKLPEGTLESLLKPENKEKLATILKYHVVPGKVMAADVAELDGEEVATAAGPKATITVAGSTVMVDKAKVVKTDIECSNGVIHVIDSVILPPAE